MNPPFVPFTSSGNGGGGAFDLAATPAATPSNTPGGPTRTPGRTPAPSPTPTRAPDFANPQRVTIAGYSGDAMEPFVTRDGRLLFFNNSNQSADTNLFWAVRIDDLAFQFRGEIG